MNDAEQAALQYHRSLACSEQWADFLSALSGELQAQMSPEENRAFFYVLGRRIAESLNLPRADTLEALEATANQRFLRMRWGWTRIQDIHSSVEIIHSCAPLRQAFGDEAMAWCGGLLEGLYATWMKQLGAGEELQLRQVGQAEGPYDALRFRLAHAGLFV